MTNPLGRDAERATLMATPIALSPAIEAALAKNTGSKVDSKRLGDIEEIVMRTVCQVAEEYGYDVTDWSARCYMPPIKWPPNPITFSRLVDGKPMLVGGEPIATHGELTVLLVTPEGQLVELDCAQWMLENRKALSWQNR
jgi:hypothetical protein